jgi:hypothetical protein
MGNFCGESKKSRVILKTGKFCRRVSRRRKLSVFIIKTLLEKLSKDYKMYDLVYKMYDLVQELLKIKCCYFKVTNNIQLLIENF